MFGCTNNSLQQNWAANALSESYFSIFCKTLYNAQLRHLHLSINSAHFLFTRARNTIWHFIITQPNTWHKTNPSWPRVLAGVTWLFRHPLVFSHIATSDPPPPHTKPVCWPLNSCLLPSHLQSDKWSWDAGHWSDGNQTKLKCFSHTVTYLYASEGEWDWQ